MTSTTDNRVRSLFMVALVVFSVVSVGAIGAMGAATYDNETTDTSSESDWQQDTTVEDLDNSTKTATIEVQSDNASSGDDFVLRVSVNDTQSDMDGEYIYNDTSSWTATNETAGHYELNVTHADVFQTLERGAGENVTLDVTTVVNESESSEESATIQIHAQNGEDVAVSTVTDGEDGLETENQTGRFAFSLSSLNPFSDDEDNDTFDGAAQATETVDVNATNTSEVRVELIDSDAADAGSLAVEDADSGDFIGLAAMQVDGEFVPVFAEDASDVDWIDTDSDVYATIDSEGDTVTYHNVHETVDSDTSVELETTLNDGMGLRSLSSMLSEFDDLSTFQQFRMAATNFDVGGSPF